MILLEQRRASSKVHLIPNPRIFLTPVLIGLVIFTLLGLVKDRHKIYSLVGLAIGVLMLFVEFKDAADSVKLYEVETVRGSWSKKITAQGDQFLYLNAQNGKVTSSITATIKVNGTIVETETSNGRFAIASASCNPKDVNH